MSAGPEVTWAMAFLAGVLSFASPCVAPLIPGYVSYVSGMSTRGTVTPARRTFSPALITSLLFVVGFSLVFVLLGASASIFGGLLEDNRRLLNRVAGIVMIAMGLVVMGAFRVPFLYQERRFHPVAAGLGQAGTVVLGMAFAFGWTPCIGPILAAILFYAGSTEATDRAALLLLVYSLGLGLPFVAVGVGFGRALTALGWLKRHGRLINTLSGALLIAVGLLLWSDRFFYLSILAQRIYYTLAY